MMAAFSARSRSLKSLTCQVGDSGLGFAGWGFRVTGFRVYGFLGLKVHKVGDSRPQPVRSPQILQPNF